MTELRQHRKSTQAPCKDLQAQLFERYGPLLGGQDLRRVLGYPSAAAFRQAALRGALPVPVFNMPNRKGRFALTQEVCAWLLEQRDHATLPLRLTCAPAAQKDTTA